MAQPGSRFRNSERKSVLFIPLIIRKNSMMRSQSGGMLNCWRSSGNRKSNSLYCGAAPTWFDGPAGGAGISASRAAAPS